MAVDLHEVNCPGCGAPMDGHLCPSSSGPGVTLTKVEYVRGTGPRKAATAHPDCPHCGGRIHFNMGATPINVECLWRIYLLGTGKIADPKDKLPEMFLSNMIEAAHWFEEEIGKGKTFSYGKQGGGTYSTRRKTPTLTPASVSPAFPDPTAPNPTAAATPTVKPYVKGPIPNPAVKEEAPAPPKESTKDELRAKRRELLKARAKK